MRISGTFLEKVYRDGTNHLNSSLSPYASTISGISFITAVAASFIKPKPRRSFGLWKSYLVVSLTLLYQYDLGCPISGRKENLWNPRPSIRITMKVFCSRTANCSKALT